MPSNCFQSFLHNKGGIGSSGYSHSSSSYHHPQHHNPSCRSNGSARSLNHSQSRTESQSCSDSCDGYVPEAPKNRYGYKRTNHNRPNSYPLSSSSSYMPHGNGNGHFVCNPNDSFQTDRTGRSDSTHGGSYVGGGGGSGSAIHNSTYKRKKHKPRVAAICRFKGTRGRERDAHAHVHAFALAKEFEERLQMHDDVSFSQRSQVGLLGGDAAGNGGFLSSSFDVPGDHDDARGQEGDQDHGHGNNDNGLLGEFEGALEYGDFDEYPHHAYEEEGEARSGSDPHSSLMNGNSSADHWSSRSPIPSAAASSVSPSTASGNHLSQPQPQPGLPHPQTYPSFRPNDYPSDGSHSHSYSHSQSQSRSSRKSDRPSSFKGCVPKLKKNREQIVDSSSHGRTLPPSQFQSNHKHYNGNGNVNVNVNANGDHMQMQMPHIPEGAQLPKYDTSMVIGDESNFPQIIFANHDDANPNAPAGNVRHRYPHSHGPGHPNETPYEYSTTAADDYNRHHNPNPNAHNESYDSYRSKASPIKSDREYTHEAYFLDNLANTLTTNYHDLQQNIYELTGKSKAQRLLEQAMREEQMGPCVPDVVGDGMGLDQSDAVSEFGMGSTSGGRYNDNASIFEKSFGSQGPGKSDYGPSPRTRSRSKSIDRYAPGPCPDPSPVRSPGYPPQVHERWEEPHRVSRSEIDRRTMQWLHQGGENPGPSSRRYNSNLDSNGSRGSASEHYYDNINYAQQYTAEFSNPYEEQSGANGFDEFHLDRIPVYYNSASSSASQRESDGFEINEEGAESESNFDYSASDHDPRRRIPHKFMNDVASPTKINATKPRARKSDAASKWGEGSHKHHNYHSHSQSSQKSHTSATDGASHASSSASPFSRSQKYREFRGTPYKITKDDRKLSVDSTQTQKWSNTRNSSSLGGNSMGQRRDPRTGQQDAMSTHLEEEHDEESCDSESFSNDRGGRQQSQANGQQHEYKKVPPRTPRAVVEYSYSSDNYEL